MGLSEREEKPPHEAIIAQDIQRMKKYTNELSILTFHLR
jgi:hypothetical protein